MSFDRTVELLRDAKTVLITCHRRPDADALGSALGLSRALAPLGKKAVVWVPEPIPVTVRFLPYGGEVVDTLPPDAKFDVTICTDTAAKSLLPVGIPEPCTRGPLVIIDHHAAHDDVGEVVFRDTQCCATGEMILRILDALGATLTKEVAVPLYAAIVADTGGFRYPATRAETMRIGARLLDAGADPWATAYELFEGWELPRIKLLGAVLDTLKLDLGGKLAMLRVTRAMLAQHGATDDMVEGMVNYGRMLAGVEIAALVWEWPVKDPSGNVRLDTKISLRTRGAINVATIAVALGGGGHASAAGGQIEASIEETELRIRAEAARLLGV